MKPENTATFAPWTKNGERATSGPVMGTIKDLTLNVSSPVQKTGVKLASFMF